MKIVHKINKNNVMVLRRLVAQNDCKGTKKQSNSALFYRLLTNADLCHDYEYTIAALL